MKPTISRIVTAALLLMLPCALVQGKGTVGAAAPSFHPSYRVGKAPRPEFKVGGRTFKIDAEAKSTKRVRGLSSEEFDPTTRRNRTDAFYHDTFKDHYGEYLRDPEMRCGPFRPDFLHWVHHWPVGLRARWAWHHHAYFEDALWDQWMTDPAFASAITVLQRSNTPVEDGWLPPEYANTSAAFVYNDEYMDAAFNPIPFLAVLTLKSIKPDPQNDWIGTAAAESLVSKLSATPGMFIADRQQVVGVLQDQKLKDADVVEPDLASHIGKALDVEQVVTGSYVVDGDSVLFNLRIVDVQTGAVQEGISKTVSRDHLLQEMPGLASSLTEALGFQQQEESPAHEADARVVNLLSLVDVQRDGVNGVWRMEQGALLSDASGGSRIEFPYQAPDEYDFRIVFTRTGGVKNVNQYCAARGRQFMWIIGGWNNTISAFEMIAGQEGDKNPTGKRNATWLKNGQEYTSVVKVRRSGVQAYLDGKLISALQTDYSDLSLRAGRTLRHNDVIGVGSNGSPTVFRTIEVIEVTGQGKIRN